jgi:hypothetical protein
MTHHWTREDDLIVLYLFKFDTRNIPYTMDQIALNRGMTIGSLRMRIANMRAIAGQGGLDHFGRITRQVYVAHHTKTLDELRKIAFPELD